MWELVGCKADSYISKTSSHLADWSRGFVLGLAEEIFDSLSSSSSLILSSFFTSIGGFPNVRGNGMLFQEYYPRWCGDCRLLFNKSRQSSTSLQQADGCNAKRKRCLKFQFLKWRRMRPNLSIIWVWNIIFLLVCLLGLLPRTHWSLDVATGNHIASQSNFGSLYSPHSRIMRLCFFRVCTTSSSESVISTKLYPQSDLVYGVTIVAKLSLQWIINWRGWRVAPFILSVEGKHE